MMFEEGTKALSHKGTKARRRRCARGVTFTEVMFAVILLGIGFIMVAAIFPVAIQQSQQNLEDVAGMAVAKNGYSILSSSGALVEVQPAGANTNYIYHINVDPVLPAGRVKWQLHKSV